MQEKERDHFSQYITEDFATYVKRKRKSRVYGNNVEMQAFAELYNRPIEIFSYSFGIFFSLKVPKLFRTNQYFPQHLQYGQQPNTT